jgi:hypothetical protein
MLNRRKFLTAAAAGLGGVSTLSALGGIVASGDHRDVLPAPHTPTPGSWADNAITLAWLGHATVFINFYGVRVLTDPTLFPRIGVDAWITTFGPLRLMSCALSPSQLPEIDLVLVSHAHFDHLDTPSLAALPGRPAALMAWGTSDLLPRKCYASVRELRWGESVRIDTARGDLEVRAIEVKHWGARPVAMADAAGARLFVPVHHKTFPLSHEPFHEPISRTETALAAEADRLVVRDVGDTAHIA